jgi:endonuclease VIII
MPEGDTIFRTATSIRKWIGGRHITAAEGGTRNRAISFDPTVLIGRTLAVVEPQGKHVLMQFDHQRESPLLLRTHMMMSGSWHVYPADARWQRPKHQANLILAASDRLAVCFNAPVVELTNETVETAVGVKHLGPDILKSTFDPRQCVERARRLPSDRGIGEVLLDQTVVAGIGNIYRCESLFLQRHHPWKPVGSLSTQQLVELLVRAQTLMQANLTPNRIERDFATPGAETTWVYRRSGRPCSVCQTSIISKPQGPQARTAYWCPACQPAPSRTEVTSPAVN